MAQLVKNCLSMREMQETRVRALGREHPLKKGMETHSRILAYRIPWTGEPGRLQFMSLQRDAHDWVHAQAWKTNKQKKIWMYNCTHTHCWKNYPFFLLNCPCTIVKDQLTILCMGILGFPGCTSGKMRWIPGWVKYPRGGLDNPLQYSCLENPIDRGAWQAMVHRIAKSWTQLKLLSMHTCTIILIFK